MSAIVCGAISALSGGALLVRFAGVEGQQLTDFGDALVYYRLVPMLCVVSALVGTTGGIIFLRQSAHWDFYEEDGARRRAVKIALGGCALGGGAILYCLGLWL